LSADGRHLVFAGRGKDSTALWLHSFDSNVSRLLPGTEGGTAPFWSPDGLAVAFFTETRLKRVSIATGEVATICEARFGGGGTWNRDGVILFAPGIDTALFRVAAAGGTPSPVTMLDAAREESGHVAPLFLPDGRHFVFAAIGGGNGSGTYVGSLDAPERKRLSSEMSIHGFSSRNLLLFLHDRTLMAQRLDLDRLELTGEPFRVAEGIDRIGFGSAIAASPSGALAYWPGARTMTQPTWFRRDGTIAGTLGSPAGYMNVALSYDGKQAAADRFDLTPGIWLLDTARGSATRATFGGVYESTPVWSPDGLSFVFAGASTTPPNLHVKRIGAGDSERLFGTAAQTLFPQSWSRDGRFIAYVSMDPQTEADIWVLATSGDRQASPFLRTRFYEAYARISPDGRWMAYSSTESGRESVYITRFPEPGEKWSVSAGGGSFPVWRHDSRELFYRAADGKLMAVPIGPGADLSPGTPTPLFEPQRAEISTLGYGTFYDVAPDGRFLINILVERISPPATVVLNWRPE
jgi:Tol biopolymer transport system component